MEQIDYKKRFKALRNRFILLAITIASIIIVALVAVNLRISSSIESKDGISSLINISGRQRMLSQSVAKLSLLILENDASAEGLVSDLDSLLSLFEESHYTLVSSNNSLNSKAIDEKFAVIQPIFETLNNTGMAFIAAPSIDKRARIIELESEFLPIMDDLVKEYEELGSKSYLAINKNVSLSNYAIILLVVLAAILTYQVAIRIVKNYSIELSNRSTELRETQIELEKSRVKEQFAYIASHDLQEPVRTIISLAELLQKRHVDTMDADGKQIIQFVKDSGNRMTQLIKGLLDYSRLGKNQEYEKVDLNELLDTIVRDLNAQIVDKSAEIQFSNMPTISGFRLDLHSIFQNLVSNAIKFSKLSEASKIEISYSEDVKYWFFNVKDNGIGMELKDREKVFQIFQRLHNRSKFDGVGIGLAHCKRIAEIHRGSISVESEIGVGSDFQFSISKELA